MIRCPKCRFRLMINKREFHCAAYPHNWGFLSDLEDDITMPIACYKFIKGNGEFVGKELLSSEFWRIAGERIRPIDWATWSRL